MDVLKNTDEKMHYIYHQCCLVHITLLLIVMLEHLDMENMLWMFSTLPTNVLFSMVVTTVQFPGTATNESHMNMHA